MITKLKEIYQTTFLHVFLFWLIELPYYCRIFFVSDKSFIERRYKKTFGVDGSFTKPKTLNEVILHRCLLDRRDFYTECSDKYRVRDIVKQEIGEEYLIPLIGVYEDVRDICFDILPDKFVIKVNHGSGQNIIVNDKNRFNEAKCRYQLKYWMRKNHYYNTREWQYKNIPSKILIEKLLLDSTGRIPYDYKFHCINGKVEFIQLDVDRYGLHKEIFYSTDWCELPFLWSPTLKDGTPKYKRAEAQPKPIALDKMVQIAETLGSSFYYVRVDLYLLGEQIYFGELTLSHGGGFSSFFDDKHNEFYGRKVDLNFGV